MNSQASCATKTITPTITIEAQPQQGQTRMEQGLGCYGSLGFMILVFQTEVISPSILLERGCRLKV